MKNLLLTLTQLFLLTSLSAQIVGRLELKEDIIGICDKHEVYTLFPSIDKNQVDAICPVSEETILNRLNNEVKFIKENPKTKCEGMVKIIINCSGKPVLCKITNSTGIVELDDQILEVFKSLGDWKNGYFNGKAVDCVQLFSYKIRKGIFKIK